MFYKKLRWRICCYLFIIPILVLTIVYIAHKPFAFGNSSLGNELSAYFYTTNSIVYVSDYVGHKNRTSELSDKDLIAFYHNWDWQRQKNLIDYNSGLYETWSQFYSGGNEKPNYLLYWQTIRPIIRDFYNKNLPFKTVAIPVVHFRCSDAPFIRCPWYNLTKKSSVEWMAAQIKDRGYTEVILLSCHKHKSMDKEQSCEKFADFYAEIFNTNGIKVTKQCNSIYEDFVIMVNSPLLVSLNSSSYSFMAGIAKDPHNYISCNMGLNLNNKYYLQNSADWILDGRAPLLHEKVVDYNDADAVIKLLK